MAKKLSFWEEDVALVKESRYLRNSWPALTFGQKEKGALRKCLLRRLEWKVKEAQRMGLVPGNDQLFDLPVFRKAVADDDAWKRQKEQEKEKEEQARREAEEKEREELEEARRRKEEAQAAERERERKLKMQQRKEELRQRHNEETEKYKMEMAQYEVLKKRWENSVAAKASALKEAEETLMNATAKKQELEHLMAEATAKKTELLGQLHVALDLEKGDKSAAEEEVNVSERFNLKKVDRNNRSFNDKEIHDQDIDSKSNEVINETTRPSREKDRHVRSIPRQSNDIKRNWGHVDSSTSRKDKDIHDGLPSLSENKRSRSLSRSHNAFKRESPGDRGFHYYDRKSIHVRYKHAFDGSRRQVVDQWQESDTQDCRDRRGYADDNSMLQPSSVSEKHRQERNFGSLEDKGAQRSQYLEERVERRTEASRRGQMRSMRSHLMKAPSQQERYVSNEQASRHSSKLSIPPDNRRADFYRIRNSRGRGSSSRYHMDSRIRFSHEESFRRHIGERNQQRELNRKIGK